MEITSFVYVLLLLISFVLFYLIPGKYRIPYLVLLSIIFIASYGLSIAIYLVAFGLFNFIVGIFISLSDKRKKILFWTGIAINISQLAILKYYSFLIDPILHWFKSEFSLSVVANFIIPLGISFYTLQGIGYLINIYRRWEKPEMNFFNFLLYIVFFPKFLSGPVERSNKFLPQLNNIGSFNQTQISNGLKFILVGFFKKIVIANPLSSIIVYSANADNVLFNGTPYWIIFLIQPIYLYFDFSGYTDIAIGTAKLFDIQLSRNFERPFFAENVSVFWRRFHMSMTSWFNDYIFKQLAFKYRKLGIFSSTMAVFATFVLLGLWHGAGLNYLILGIMQAIAINFEYFTKDLRRNAFSVLPASATKWMGRLLTYLFYCLTLVFFFSPDIGTTSHVLSGLFHKLLSGFDLPEFGLFFAFICLFIELLQNDYRTLWNRIEHCWKNRPVFRYSLYYIMIISIVFFKSGKIQFIYQQF